ncbi:M48 family metalloprotease, partial [Arthrospira platensis SPKY2]
MNKKSSNLQYVEECFAELNFDNLKDSNNKKILDTIQRFLNREFGSISKCVDIKIAKNDGTSVYGMMVTPSMSSFNQIVGDVNGSVRPGMDNGTTSRVSEYVIEIDSKINSPLLRLTPAEMTAMLIHEIGHIVSDSKFIEDMNLMYLEAMTKKFPEMDKAQAKNDVMIRLYIFNHLTKHQLCNEVKNLAVERKADKFVIETGYGNELMIVLQKFAELYNKS